MALFHKSLHHVPQLQDADADWEEEALTDREAWRDLWALAGPGFSLVAVNGLQHVDETGVLVMLAPILGSMVSLLGPTVSLVPWSTDSVEVKAKNTYTLVVRFVRKIGARLDEEVDTLHFEMGGAWNRNGPEFKGPITGALCSPQGALMFRMLSKDAKVTALTCSDYMSTCDSGGRVPMPGRDLALWLNRMMAAAFPECRGWDRATWAMRREDAETRLDARVRKFEKVAGELAEP